MTVVVIFRCGDRRCALERASVGEVAPVPELTQPPGMSANIAGFFSLAGDALPVVDAAALFGVASDPNIDPIYRHILIVGSGDERLGLLVDRVEDVRRIDLSTMVATPDEYTLNDCVAGEVTINDAPVAILIPDRILLAAEKARLVNLRVAEQARLDALAPT